MYLTVMPRKPVDIETSELRKRVRAAIEAQPQAARPRAARSWTKPRRRTQSCSKCTAIPLVQMLANALRAEGLQLHGLHAERRPAHGARQVGRRLHRVRARHVQDEPFAALRVNRTRGRRVVQHERPVKGRTPVGPAERRGCPAGAARRDWPVRRTVGPPTPASRQTTYRCPGA